MKKKRERLFKLTEKDFTFKYTIGSGPGGQNKQKTLTAVHCSHKPSGAQGYAQDMRDQLSNKRLAFKRMCDTIVFKAWLGLKIDAANGKVEIEEADDVGIIRKRLVRHDEI